MASYKWVWISSISCVILYAILSWGFQKIRLTTFTLQTSSVDKTNVTVTTSNKPLNNTSITVEELPFKKTSNLTWPPPATKKAQTVTTKQFVEDLPLEFRVCRLNKHHPPVLGGPPVTMMEYQNATMGGFGVLKFRYQCAGDHYEQFLYKHQYPYIMNQHLTNKNWGTRPTMVPLLKKNNSRHILVIGNSHTRQMIASMLGQYQDQIQRVTPRDSNNTAPAIQYTILDGVYNGIQYAMQYTLLDGDLVVTVFLNHPVLYSEHWIDHMTDIMGVVDLNKNIDAIVLGKFNTFKKQFSKALQWTNVKRYGLEHPEQNVDPARGSGVRLQEVAKRYKGPIIWCSMMAKGDDSHQIVAQQIAQIASTTGRTNLRSVYARRHAKAMGNVECGSDNHEVVATCVSNDTRTYFQGHRCIGEKGGQPDLVAWDVIEALYEVLAVSNIAGKRKSNGI